MKKMEWANLYESLSKDYLGDISPQTQFDRQLEDVEWTKAENKIFENALAEFDLPLELQFEVIATRIPTKSVPQIKQHYEDLVIDIDKIEAGDVPLPNYVDDHQHADGLEAKKDQQQLASSASQSHKRKRGVPWTEDEHSRFLEGLKKFGKGDWRNISRHFVVTKTPTQVASHAQKYYRRLNSNTPPDRRRPSIHDIQAVTPSPTPTPHINPYPPQGQFQRHNSDILNFNNNMQAFHQTPAPNYVGFSLTPTPIANSYSLNFGEGSSGSGSSSSQWVTNPSLSWRNSVSFNQPSAPSANATYAPPAFPSFNPSDGCPSLMNSYICGEGLKTDQLY